MNAKRLLKLADFLDTVPREKFDYSKVAVEGGKPMREAFKAGRTACGTVGCALGWAPLAFPRSLEWKPAWNGKLCVVPKGGAVRYGSPWFQTVDTAESFFGLSASQVEHLFNPNVFPNGGALPSTATPKQVARHIRRFVREAS